MNPLSVTWRTVRGMTRYVIDSSKLENELSWKTQIPFEAGLQDTIDWYRGNSAWVEHVRSGAYRTYYDQMYQKRCQTLSER